ncbi:MAG: TRAP transporter large permease subunit [Rhodomicrobium sp.]
MTEFLIHNMAPIMFASLIVVLLLGYPVAFALAANGLAFGFLGIELGLFSPSLLQALPERVLGVMSNDTLLAIPFFTFMGLILERSGMAEDLLDTVGQLFGPVRGGLAYAVVLVGALLAATTGVVAASVIAMGLISLPIMLRYGYKRSLAAGVIAASGTLAQIIPPSLVLIVMADQLGRSVGDMYQGAFIPGLALAGLYMLYVLLVTLISPKAAPALPKEARTLGTGVSSLFVTIAIGAAAGYWVFSWLEGQGREGAPIWGATAAVALAYVLALLDRGLKIGLLSRLAQQVIIVLIPPLALIFLVLGTIFLGIATPTEGGAMGATGALILAAFKGRLTGKLLVQGLDSTTKLSSFVLFILIGARVFSLVFYGVNGHVWVESLLLNLPGGQLGFLIIVNLFVFVLAFFLDFFELAFIIVPLLGPVAEKLGIDLIWFGVLLGVNLQTSFMHPPFGFALFFLRSVAARDSYIDKPTGRLIEPVTTAQIYWGAIPFVVIQLIMVSLVIAFPQMVTHYKGSAPENPAAIKFEVPPIAPLSGSPFGDAPNFSSPPPGLGGPPASQSPSGPPPGLADAPKEVPPPSQVPSGPPPGLEQPAKPN